MPLTVRPIMVSSQKDERFRRNVLSPDLIDFETYEQRRVDGALPALAR